MENTNAAANTFAADIQQMMNDWNAAAPAQRAEFTAYAAALAAKADARVVAKAGTKARR